MNFRLKTAAAAFLAVSLVASYGFAEDATPPAKKKATKKAPTAPSASVEQQIEKLRTDLEGQIYGLKTDLAEKDAQLKKAQQAAADAQAAAEKAEAAAAADQKAMGDNAAAVTALQGTVTDLKGNQASLAATVSDETGKLKKAIENPTALRYKGITITPYGFLAGETAWRAHATGGEMPTPFSSIPYEGADAYSLSEFFMSGRQSRIGMNLEGKTNWGTLRGIVEGDFLGVGTTSNDNQSNSYLFRQRVIMGEVETKTGWTVSAGQGWSLAAETKKGISTLPSNIALPNQIDPNYVTGLVWTRSGNIRVTKSFKNAALAFSLENPQLLYSAAMAGNTPYAVIGSQGTNGGLLNAAINSCSPSTSIVNYTNQAQTDSAGNKINVAVPVYKTVNSCANLANYSFNDFPDMVFKAAIDPTPLSHFEVFGIGRIAHETVYLGETTNSNLYGGLKDIATGLVIAPALSAANPIENKIYLGGAGASGRVALPDNKLVFGAKALYGPGVGHFGDSTLSDVTNNYWGGFSPIHNLSGLLTVEANPNPRLNVYLYYGGDYASRATSSPTPYNPGLLTPTTLGAPSADFCVTGTTTCTTTPTAAQIAAGGTWGAHWAAPAAAPIGYGSYIAANASCNTVANPGFSGSSTGYYPGGSCGAATRDVQEITGGYWYDIYKGDRGRLRQGIQYGYAVREGWSGAAFIGAKGIDNMFFTSFRYYLP